MFVFAIAQCQRALKHVHVISGLKRATTSTSELRSAEDSIEVDIDFYITGVSALLKLIKVKYIDFTKGKTCPLRSLYLAAACLHEILCF